MECEMVVSIIQTNAGLPFTFSPYKFIKENMFFCYFKVYKLLRSQQSKKPTISLQLELSYGKDNGKELTVFLNIIHFDRRKKKGFCLCSVSL